MKTKKYILWLLDLMLCATPVLTACSDSDDDNINNTENSANGSETMKYDDLAVFQNAICRIDSLGHLAYYHVGEAIYEAEPQHLYIGVDDIEEAANWFRNWIAPDVELGNITPTTTDLTANLTDTLGHSQGTIYFKAGSGQSVAEVTYSPETQLKYIDRITFMLNSAWPFNSSGKQWHKGDIKTFYITGDAGEGLDDDDNPLNFVLIREGGNGVKPMWCAITNNSYKNVREEFWKTDFEKVISSDYCPGLGKANTISDILCSDWGYFASKFNEAGEGKLEYGESYFIDHYEYKFAEAGDHLMVYDRKEIKRASSNWSGGSKQPFLLKIDWLNDGERTFLVTDCSPYALDGYGPENLFDGTCTNTWKSDWAWGGVTSTVSGKECMFVEFQADPAIKPRAYQLWTTNMSGEDWIYYRRIPSIWALYAKKNSRSKWELLDSQYATELPHKNYDGWGKEFSGINSEYQFFRFEVYNNWGEDIVQLGQLKILE